MSKPTRKKTAAGISAAVAAGLVAGPLVATGATAPAQAAQEVTAQQVREDVQVVFDDLNDYRASQGLPRLKYSSTIEQIATAEATRAAESGDINHSMNFLHDTRAGHWKSTGEITALSGKRDAHRFVKQWRNSPAHDAIMKRADFDVMGIGLHAVVDDDGFLNYVATVDFYGYGGNIPSTVKVQDRPGGAQVQPTQSPSPKPTAQPTAKPTAKPTVKPTARPTQAPTAKPTQTPTSKPTAQPSQKPTVKPTTEPSQKPTAEPSKSPTSAPSPSQTIAPTPTAVPTEEPTSTPSAEPTQEPTSTPSTEPTAEPTQSPTSEPTATPTTEPSTEPSASPTVNPDDPDTPQWLRDYVNTPDTEMLPYQERPDNQPAGSSRPLLTKEEAERAAGEDNYPLQKTQIANSKPQPAWVSEVNLSGAIGEYYHSDGAGNKYGAPVGQEATGLFDGGVAQGFSGNFDIVYHPATGAHAVDYNTAIGKLVADQGYQKLGYPTGNEMVFPTHSYQEFYNPVTKVHKTVYSSPSTGAHVLDESTEVGQSFKRYGRLNLMGLPVHDEVATDDGAHYQFFRTLDGQSNLIMSEPGGGQGYLIKEDSPIGQAWASAGREMNWGYPVTNPYKNLRDNAIHQRFSHGIEVKYTAEEGVQILR